MTTPESARATHVFFATCVGACVAFGWWSATHRLDVVSVAIGQVVPSSQVKRVQHLEGGIVREILVKEGARVAKDQPLVALEQTAFGADFAELQSRLLSLTMESTRLEAEAAGRPRFDPPEAAARAHPELAAQARTLFETRQSRLRSDLAAARESVVQRQQAAREVSARITNTRQSLKLIDEQVKISEELLKQELSNRYTHLTLLREQSALRSRLDEDGAALARLESSLQEGRAQLERIPIAFQEEVRTALETARRGQEEIGQRLRKFQDSVSRTILRAPVEGVVKTLYVATEGGVVRPGDTVADLVPVEDSLVVEARLPPADIGYVQVGQKATVKLMSADALRFGTIAAAVVHVSPDTLTTERGAPFYKVRLETERNFFQRGAQRHELYPGMQLSAGILTGERSVLEYLLDPFLDSLADAMRER